MSPIVGLANDDQSNLKLHKMRIAQLNLFYTSLVMTIMFVVCGSVSVTSLFLDTIGHKAFGSEHGTNVLARVGVSLATLNSVINPYVYAIQYKDFKLQLRVIFCGEKEAESSQGRSTQMTHSNY